MQRRGIARNHLQDQVIERAARALETDTQTRLERLRYGTRGRAPHVPARACCRHTAPEQPAGDAAFL